MATNTSVSTDSSRLFARYFLDGDSSRHIASVSIDNAVEFFTDDKTLFRRMGDDILLATKENDFVYFANWWCDLDVPLGDPSAQPAPPRLRQVLKSISSYKPLEMQDASVNTTARQPGAQVCALLWQHKHQMDSAIAGLDVGLAMPLSIPLASLGVLPLFASIFGGELLSKLNLDAVRFINTLESGSYAILDDRTLACGSHHQKFLVVGNSGQLIAYCGAADFNADRVYPYRSPSATNPPPKGAPLSDVSIRVEGPAAWDILDTFVTRWKLHPESKGTSLRGASFVGRHNRQAGPYAVQITHTYGRDFPFHGESVRSAAEALLKLISTAKRYIYFEDQYLVGTPELKDRLIRVLGNNASLRLVAVMSPFAVVGDLPQLLARRSIFWGDIMDLYRDRVRLFERLGKGRKPEGDGSYLHAKLTIVDDVAFCVGTVNCSRRSWYHDSEIMATVAGTQPQPGPVTPTSMAAQLRIRRWSEYLAEDPSQLTDLESSIPRWSNLSPSAAVAPWYPASRVPLGLAADTFWDAACDPAL